MTLTKDDIKTINGMLTDLRSGLRSEIHLDMKILLKQELAPIKTDIAELKQRVDQLYRMVKDDIGLAFQEIETLKKRIKKLEAKVQSLR